MYGKGFVYFNSACKATADDKNIKCDYCKDNEGCEYRQPVIIEGNTKIWHLFYIIANQWRADVSGPTGLDYGVVIEVAKTMDIEINQSFFEKLRAYESAVLDNVTDQKGTGK